MSRRIVIAMCLTMGMISVLGGVAFGQESTGGPFAGLLQGLRGSWDSIAEHRGDIITFLWWELLPVVLVNLVFLFFLDVIGMHPSRAIRGAYAFFILSSYAIYHVLFRPPVQSYQLWVIWGLLGIAVIGLLAKLPRTGWNRAWISRGG